MARTNIVLDDALVKKAMALTAARSKRQVVDLALRQLVERANVYRGLRKLRGKAAWEGNIDAWRRERR